MGNRVEVTNDFIIINDGNIKTQIPINETLLEYQVIKSETNNFTENMDFPPTIEEKLQADIDYLAIMTGVDLNV